MQYTYLGKSGLKVSRLCLGTMNFGPETEEKDAFRIMDAAVDAGIQFFDTANVYGRDRKGWTEEIIGRWFKQGEVGARRWCWLPRSMAICRMTWMVPMQTGVCRRTRLEGIWKPH